MASSGKWLENIGEIMLSEEDEFCWMLPDIFIFTYDYSVASPYFSFDQESWRLIIIPSNNEDEALRDINYFGLFLWLKGGYILKRNYNVQLSIKAPNGDEKYSCSGKLDSFYGFGKWNFLKCDDIPLHFVRSGRLKISCIIQRKEDDSTNLVLCPASKNIRDENETLDKKNKKQKIGSEAKGVDRMVQNFRHLLDSESGCDVILKTSDHKFHAHRIILSARCPVFSSMFQHDMSEKNTGEVDISDCSTAGFKVFLQYIYSGNAEGISPDNVLDLYYISDKYQVDDLKSDCVEYMKNNLTVSNICNIIALCLRHSELELQTFATSFFCRNVKNIVKSVEWQKYICENPLQANELFIKAINA